MQILTRSKSLVGMLGVFLAVTVHATTCDEAKEYLIQTAAQIRANHQVYDSFNIYNQEKILELDKAILKSNNYTRTLSFTKNNCHI